MKKVLIITYYWPPAGGPGIQRWLKFVKYLPNFGIEPIVYAPQNPQYPITDTSFNNEIPQDVRVIKKPVFEPYSYAALLSKQETRKISSGIITEEKDQTLLQKAMLYIRGNFFIPDARKFWIKPSVKFLTSLILDEKIETIITTGPPHSVHIIGLRLKQKLDITWFADFRDPWTQIGYHKRLKLTEKSRRKHLDLEKEVINTATHIITTSFTTKKEFAAKTSKPVSVITNGFDAEEEPEVNKRDSKFSLSHIGSLLSERNPENLWQVLAEIIAENNAFAGVFELKLVGTVSEEVLRSIKLNGLQAYLRLTGYVDHVQAVRIQRSSQVLLLIEINREETRGIIPGKLFEYLAAKRPIMAFGPQKWDVEHILEETRAGKYFHYSTRKELKEYILYLYSLYQKGELSSNSSGIEKFNRKKLTENLANLLKQN